MKFDKKVIVTLTMDDVDLAQLADICKFVSKNKKKFFQWLEEDWGEVFEDDEKNSYLKMIDFLLVDSVTSQE